MLDHIERPSASDTTAVVLAIVSSVLLGLLIWIVNKDLLWMLAVLMPPVWSPVIYRRFGPEGSGTVSRVGVAVALLGLVAMLGIAVLVFFLL